MKLIGLTDREYDLREELMKICDHHATDEMCKLVIAITMFGLRAYSTFIAPFLLNQWIAKTNLSAPVNFPCFHYY